LICTVLRIGTSGGSSSTSLLFLVSSIMSIMKSSASKMGRLSPQFNTSSRRVDVVRWNLRNSATWNNNLNIRAYFVFCSWPWTKYFLYFTQKSFTISRCEWSAERGLEAVMKEKRFPALIGDKISVVQCLALLQFIDNIFWRFSKTAKSDCKLRRVCLSVRPSS